MSKLMLALVLISGSLMAADVTGKWSGTAVAKGPDGSTNQDAAFLSLKQSGDTVTGMAGSNESQGAPIVDGKIDGDLLTFRVAVGEAKVIVKLRLSGDTLKGDATVDTPDGPGTAVLELKRVP